MTLEEIIKSNVLTLIESEEEDKFYAAKKISCPFFISGKHPGCKFCQQPEDKVLECADAYIEYMKEWEAAVWSPELDQPKEREEEDTFTFSTGEVKIGLKCDTCYLQDSCPKFKAGYKCAINWEEKDLSFNATQLYEKLIAIQFSRINRAKAIEVADGGVPDQILSTEMDRLTRLIDGMSSQGGFKMSLNMSGGSEAAKPAGSLLASIFGIGKPAELPAPQEAEIIDLPVTIKKDAKD